ncbi:MAG: hypothetical protein [Cressdnaviricota sp.]|nr:MAG: hypothetical protein [Cressdnaviricota sp.]
MQSHIMARRKSTASNQTPAVRHLRYDLVNSETPGTETSHFIDLAKDLSSLNRRLYRQGRSYHVKRITVTSRNTIAGIYNGAVPGSLEQQSAGRISVSAAANSWVTRGAWGRGLKTFNLMNKEATHNLTNDVSGKWSDFKVYLSNDHFTNGNSQPIDNGGNSPTGGEWTYSTFISPDGTTSSDSFRIHLLGATTRTGSDVHAVGLVQSFGDTRATVDSDQPNVPGDASDDPLLNVFDYGTTIDEVIDQLEANNDNPPYDIDDYTGGDTNMPKPLVMSETSIPDGRGVMSGFEAVCGLLEVEITSPLAEDVYSVLVELAPGKYRGIKADVI